LSAVFMTGSRAGALLTLLALGVGVTLYFRRNLPPRTNFIAVFLGGWAVALLLLQIMGGGVSARLDTEGLVDFGRIATFRATSRMIMEHPWFGTGQGTFMLIYPAYRGADVSMWGTWDHAHNTLLELAAEMGLPLAGLVVLAWAVMMAVLVKGALTRRRDVIVPLAALSVSILGGIHSLIDFSLQIAGFSIVAFALMGAGLAQSLRTGGAKIRAQE
jgi:O-antigen ligase